jgi:beta-barrel assembly-enhancing protease
MRNNGRLIIAAIVLLVGIVGYFGKSSINPVTGEKQHVALSADQEVALGMQAAPQMAEQFGGLDPDENAQALVKQVGQKLVSSGPGAKTEYKFSFYLLRDPQTVNAFALPGGPIFITRALFDRLQNEAQLGGVLGHEVGHVLERHSAEHMARSQLAQSVVGAAGVAASDERGRGQMAYMAAAFAAQMAQLKYGRNDELESDRWGVKNMTGAGYDPREMIEVMEILKQSSRGRQPEFMSSHPDPGNREEQLHAQIEKDFPSGVPSSLSKGQALRARAQAAGAGSY